MMTRCCPRSVSGPSTVTRVEITASPALPCLNLAHFASLPGLQAITGRHLVQATGYHNWF